MSSATPTIEKSTPDSALSQPSKSQRVLACVLCQQRKVRCDRKYPCSNCTKSRVQCVPATLATRRRRRPNFPERELMERLRRYEDLLRQNDVKFDALFQPSAGRGGSNDSYESNHKPPETAELELASPTRSPMKPGSAYEAKYVRSVMLRQNC
jgi:hypothetical protein